MSTLELEGVSLHLVRHYILCQFFIRIATTTLHRVPVYESVVLYDSVPTKEEGRREEHGT